MAWEGHSRTSPMVLRLMHDMGTLRTLKDIPDGSTADVWHGNP